ncbi:unnamed protein product [Oppiella nova]|uniref:UDP-glycosyltransferase n=1 Tax=Oppiella nova TaxID=334625 RepID=A0A7R9LL42_9ACAR|nr:unnamed protein product [Oppiella nova]CAG2164062.1 unnamed protein product [Oppiella nova]
MQGNKKLTVLFAPTDSMAHVNACHGLAEEFRDRGHRVVFTMDRAFKGRLEKYGFEEYPIASGRNNSSVAVTQFITQLKHVFKLTPIQIADKFVSRAFELFFKRLRDAESQYKEIVGTVRPDIIVCDAYLGSPALTNSGIPFVYLLSSDPLFAMNDDNLPPPFLGLPLNENRDKWTEIRHNLNEMFAQLRQDYDKWLVANGAPPLPSTHPNWGLHPRSPYLNIYQTPEELDYKSQQPGAQVWRRVNGFVRDTGDTFVIPEPLSRKSGKLCLLSLGSMGCAHLDLMVRLTRVLGKSKHRFIVNKGPLHDKYDLPDNMWGAPYLPQTALLPLMDLVITHGGNGTVNECFYYGVPVLAMPLYGDQYDTAQRVRESGLGLRLNPFHCTDAELLGTVDDMVNDVELGRRMKAIGERLRAANDKRVIADIIEDIVSKK